MNCRGGEWKEYCCEMTRDGDDGEIDNDGGNSEIYDCEIDAGAK